MHCKSNYHNSVRHPEAWPGVAIGPMGIRTALLLRLATAACVTLLAVSISPADTPVPDSNGPPAVDRANVSIANNTDWLDVEGKPIQAHDGHITRVDDTFYWYGSSYAGNPQGRYGTAAGFAVWNGIQVYSSQDLVAWAYRGVALPRPKKGWGVVGSVGRAHVIYNDQTRTYVMWYWYHTTYPTVFTMVATSDTPVGPFKVMGAREVGSQTGFGSDLNVFADDTRKGYLVYTDHHRYDPTRRFSKGRALYAILVDSLTDDYLDSNKEGIVAIPSGGEAPAMAKYRGQYIIAASGVRGWAASETTYVVSDSPLTPLMRRQSTS